MNNKLKYLVIIIISLLSLSFAGYNAYAIGVDTGCGSCGTDTGYGYGDGGGDPGIFPSCTITATPNVVNSGDSTQLKWNTYNAIEAYIDNGINKVATGVNKSITIPAVYNTTTYRMTVKDLSGNINSCNVNVKVVAPPANPSCDFTLNPATVVPGQKVVMKWSTKNADYVKIIDVSNSLPLSGSISIYAPSYSKTYELIAKNKTGETAICKANLVVNPPVEAPSCTLRAIPSSVPYGGSATLVWTSTYATSASISSVGAVAVSGSRIIDNITSNKRYTMFVSGKGGSSVCSADINVYNIPNPILSCNIYATPNPTENNSTRVYWTSTGASWAKLNGLYSNTFVALNGSRYITGLPKGVYNYTLTIGNGYQTKTCRVSVINQSINKTPYCTLTADKSLINPGEAVKLTWSSTNAANASFVDSGLVSLYGTKYVYPSNSGYYKLIVTGKSGAQNSCSVYIATRNTTVINVSSVPYTGPNDALYVGIMGVVSLISFALVYRRRHHLKSIFGVR